MAVSETITVGSSTEAWSAPVPVILYIVSFNFLLSISAWVEPRSDLLTVKVISALSSSFFNASAFISR